MTKRQIVKIAVKFTVAGALENAAENTLENYTDIIVDDNLAATVGCAVFGVYASSVIAPYTNAAVDKIADSWIARKEMRAAKKMEESVASAA